MSYNNSYGPGIDTAREDYFLQYGDDGDDGYGGDYYSFNDYEIDNFNDNPVATQNNNSNTLGNNGGIWDNLFGGSESEGAEGSWSDGFFSTDKGKPGWGLAGLNTLSGITNAYLGLKSYGLAKDKFAFSKDITNRNLENNALVYNTQNEGYQRRRLLEGGYTENSDRYNMDYNTAVERTNVNGRQLGA